MNELSKEELQEKIEKVKQDIATQTGRKLEVLSQYKEYLEDELRMLEAGRRNDAK